MASVAPGITHEQLQDAWARWAEHRPDDLPWTTGLRIRAAAGMDQITQRRLDVKVSHVAEVSLWCWVDDRVRDDPTYATCTWEVPVEHALDVYDAMAEAFRWDDLMMACRRGYPGWQTTLEQHVWMLLRKRMRRWNGGCGSR